MVKRISYFARKSIRDGVPGCHEVAGFAFDVIDIFEENGWDWTYHAFREWSGWSVEYGNDPKDTQPAAAPTGRQQLLRKWFAKNRKPW